MNSTIRLLLIIFLANECLGVMYHLEETEVKSMPPIYHLDDYGSCLETPNDVYCSVNFNLVSDTPSDLLHLIKEYSEHHTKHFNHTKLRYGICVAKSCRYITNKTAVPKQILERCLNESMWNDYELKTEVENYKCYKQSDNDIKINAADVTIGVILLIIVMLNFFASVFEVYHKTNNFEGKKNILICFSIQRNWKRLISSTKNPDTRLQRLKGFNGIRCIMTFGVLIAHCLWPFLLASKNTYTIEQVYDILPIHILLNGPIAIQTYLVISGFLLFYKMKIHSENHKVSWQIVPKGILLRHLRLTPAYAFVIGLTATGLKFAGPSGLWEVAGQTAVSDCQNRWWLNLLYLNNYVYDSQCMLQGWYLALDMQLYCFGLILYVVLRNTRFRNCVLLTLIIVGMTICGIHTYSRDLNALPLITPGDGHDLFKSDPTFNEVYKMGHTNIPSFIIGIGLGYWVYKWQESENNIDMFRKYRIVYWALLPIAGGVILSGSAFFRDAPRDPIYIRVLYAMFYKPVFGLIIALIISGMMFRIENVYRGFLEWKVWLIPSRLSYCMFVIHFTYLRLYISIQPYLLYYTNYYLLLLTTGLATISFISAIPLWLFVEAPFMELSKCFTSHRPQKKKKILDNDLHETIKNGITYL